ncbi:MAG TPA: thioesterase [Aeromicrobium sp.]|nr:thioesterase [Aeromicrobium sp.]
MTLTVSKNVHVVGAEHTAVAVGSGDLEVLGTPVLIAWLEQATCAELELDQGLTSVGIEVHVNHVAPSAIGSTITANASITFNDGRNVDFDVSAYDQADTLVADGKVRRVIVNAERFISRLTSVGD